MKSCLNIVYVGKQNKVKAANLVPLPMCVEYGCVHVHYICRIQSILLECFLRIIAITLRRTAIETHIADSARCLSKLLIC